ncbi:MAG: hypothetical protein K2Q14_08320 [Gammaproteobacteria bacterium]|nr:hypothetical protein [Gammaproteobacteria bacterium]
MNVKREETILSKMRSKLETINSVIVLRTDFAPIGDYRQISFGLRKLIAEKKLIRVGYGLYAKAYEARYDGRPLIQGDSDAALRETLTRLRVKWEPGSAEQAYNRGESTQVPVRNIVKLKTRCRRHIHFGKAELVFEGKVNAR